jgi:hypothetical protein
MGKLPRATSSPLLSIGHPDPRMSTRLATVALDITVADRCFPNPAAEIISLKGKLWSVDVKGPGLDRRTYPS